MIRLKPCPDDGYDLAICAASICEVPSGQIVGHTCGRWKVDVPLCDRHWQKVCDDDDAAHEAATAGQLPLTFEAKAKAF